QYPLWPPWRLRCRCAARRRGRRRCGVHRATAQRLRNTRRRTRRDAIGRPAPAHRHRPRHPARCAAAAARRGNERARRGERAAGPDRAGEPDGRAHHHRHRPPPRHHPASEAHRGDGPGQGGRRGQPRRTRRAWRALCAPRRSPVHQRHGAGELTMRPAVRAATTAGAILVAVTIGIAVRTLYIYGVFTNVTPGFAGRCTAVGGIDGPEDIAIDGTSGLAFISAFDRRARAAGRSASQDGLYVLSLGDATHLTRLAGTPADFHPHGISLLRDADGLVLMAINHHADGTNSVEVFDVKLGGNAVLLSETGNIESRELVSPNAIAAVDRERFYIANDHGSTTALGRALDDYLVLPRANLLYFDGTVFRVVAQHLAFPSGLALSPDGH